MVPLLSLPVLLAIFVGLFVYWYYSTSYRYWEKVGIPYVRPFPIVGGLFETFTKPPHELEIERYKKYGRIYGAYEGSRPVLSIADPELIRRILVKDFYYFTGRRDMGNSDQIISNMLACKRGEEWKRIRSIVSPTFSTGKIKRMMSIFLDCAKAVASNLRKAAEEGKEIDVKKIFGAYTLDVIANTAFSTKINSHDDPNNKFVVNARNLFGRNLTWKMMLLFLFPSLVHFLKIKVVPQKEVNFFKEMVLRIIKERRKTGQTRNDFLQLLLDTAKDLPPEDMKDANKDEDIARNYATDTTDDKFDEMCKIKYPKSLTLDEIVAQCVMFFFAAFDSTSSVLSLSAHLLATYPDIQKKVFQEIKQVRQEYNGELTYEGIKKMKYLDNFISETLRYHSPGFKLERLAEADYVLGNTGITIPKGMMVFIPICALQRDPEFFPNPDVFNPERFSDDAEFKIQPYTFLPFSDGPRMCIAMRFALLLLKCCLAYLLSQFIFKMGSQSKSKIEFYTSQGVIQPKEVILQIETRSENFS